MHGVSLPLDATILQQFHISRPPAQWHAHCKGTREHRRILDSGLIVERIFARQAKPLYDSSPCAHEIASLVQPTAAVQAANLHDQSVALPSSARIAVP